MTVRCSLRGTRMKLSIMTAYAGSIWARISGCSPRFAPSSARPCGGKQTLNFGPRPRISMKPTLQFRLSQHLTLTPQLQQSIRLLQLSTVELNQEIERLLMDNPILEREESEPESAAGNAPRSESVASDAPAAPSSDAAPEPERSTEELPADYAAPWRGQEDDGEDGDRTHAAPDTPTLRDHLINQLALTNL